MIAKHDICHSFRDIDILCKHWMVYLLFVISPFRIPSEKIMPPPLFSSLGPAAGQWSKIVIAKETGAYLVGNGLAYRGAL